MPGSRLLTSSILGSALRTHVESLGKPCGVNRRSKKNLPGKLDIKEIHIVFSLYKCYSKI